MKRPKDKGTPIDIRRVSGWLKDFSAYRYGVTNGRIEGWLDQFKRKDRDLAARILDSVDFIGTDQLSATYRSLLRALPGWSPDSGKRAGNWRFVSFSSTAGKSGDEMLYIFRIANGLTGRTSNNLFIHMSQLLREDLGPSDTVVFVDDFAGTGDQACDVWPELQELLPGNPKTFLLVVATSISARRRIHDSTDLEVVSQIQLDDRACIFSDECIYFEEKEKKRIMHYCKQADPREPSGYGCCGFVIVFAHRCPNNTIPILHAQNRRWEGIFRRY